MAMEKFSSSPTPENSDLGPEDIAELEAQAESLGNEAVLLQGELTGVDVTENPDKRSEIYGKLLEVQESWINVTERAGALFASSTAIGAIATLLAPALEDPNITMEKYSNTLVGSSGWIVASVIAVNAIGLMANRIKHALESRNLENQL